MEQHQMSTDVVSGGGIMGDFSLCCSGFSKGIIVSTHFLFPIIKIRSSFKEKPKCGALVGAAGVGRARWISTASSFRSPTPPGPPPGAGTEPGTTSFPAPAPLVPVLWPKNFFAPETQPTPEGEAARQVIFLREREKIKIKPTHFNRFPGSGPTVHSKL